MIFRFLNLLIFIFRHPLNKNKKLSAFSRFFKWQIASRILKRPIVLNFVNDICILAQKGMTGITGNWYCGLHEVNEMAFTLHFLRPEDHFIDIGANVGSYTLLASATSAMVTSFEPIPYTYRSLIMNIKLNNIENNINSFNLGISNESTILKFTSNLDTVNHVYSKSDFGPFIEVEVMKLDEIMQNAIPPALMKIDVEGHELNVLLGAQSILSNKNLLAIIIETNSSGLRFNIKDNEIFKFLSSYGFIPYGYDPFNRELYQIKNKHENTIFIRDYSLVNDRLKSSKKYKLVNGYI
jgi:FkbM family methyltransferase